MKKPRDLLSTLAIIGGLLLVLYPTISNFLVMRNASRVIEGYDSAVEALSDEEYARIIDAARAYNAKLAGLSGIPASDGGWDAPEGDAARELKAEYASLLDLDGNGVMGYMTIPRLDETMPIYHTTEEKVLQVAAGHIETSSLPVGGGASTQAAISGHRGLSSAKLFTDLDTMRIGDVFYVRVLKETFAYQVDQILTVLPHETEALAIEPREDLMTLVTCTPYGINSHRLLVRARRALPSIYGGRGRRHGQSRQPLVAARRRGARVGGGGDPARRGAPAPRGARRGARRARGGGVCNQEGRRVGADGARRSTCERGIGL